MQTAMQCAVAAAVLVLPTFAAANDYPTRPIELIIPFGQGGGSDLVGRAFARGLAEVAGVDVRPVNRTGGAGAIGFVAGAQAAPDGYTLTMTVTSLAGNPHMIEGFPVTYEDFAPICLLSVEASGLGVAANSPHGTLTDWVDAAKADPGNLLVGYTAIGQLVALYLEAKTETDTTLVPFEGSGDTLTALIGGHVDAGIVSTNEAMPYIDAGQIRMLAVFGPERVDADPDAKTAAEQGYDIDIGFFRAVGAPRDTPPEIVAYLVDACEQVTQEPGFVAEMERLGSSIDFRGGDEFGTWLAMQHQVYGDAAALLRN